LWPEIEKQLQVVSRLTEISAPFEAVPEVLAELNWLISEAGAGIAPGSSAEAAKQRCAWLALSTASGLCSHVPWARKRFRDVHRSAATLADILLSLSPSANEKRSKVLHMLRAVTFGAKFYRLEAFLFKLVPKLIR